MSIKVAKYLTQNAIPDIWKAYFVHICYTIRMMLMYYTDYEMLLIKTSFELYNWRRFLGKIHIEIKLELPIWEIREQS